MKRFIWFWLLVGCSDDLPPGSRIERTRVLGLAARPAGDPGRAWPQPGEETTLEWLIAAPRVPGAMTWDVAVCVADPLVSLRCAEPPFYQGSGNERPAGSFVVPDAERLLVFGRLSPDGDPETELLLELPIDRGAENRHPHMGDVALAGAGWTAEGGPCDALPAVAPDAKVDIALSTPAADRETYLDRSDVERRESLRISFFATAGELDGQFRVVEADDPRDPAPAVMPWTAPPPVEVPAGGLVVRFLFAVRDLRGGIDWTGRALCVR
jgi:hypothetical protein